MMESDHSLVAHVKGALSHAARALDSLLSSEDTLAEIARAAQILTECFVAGGRVYSCGNGGSMCDAMHFAEELSGRFRLDRDPLPAIAIADPSYMSCTSNDYSWNAVFKRFIQGHARRGDVLLAISTSGKSANVLHAAEYASASGIKVIALTGPKASPLAAFADVEIAVGREKYADRTQELHIKVIHILIELIERSYFKENYGEASHV